MGGTRLERRKVRAVYVRVARVDWPMVRLGRKREFRATDRGSLSVVPQWFPAAIVLWCPMAYGPEPEQQLVVCESAWTERLGEISAESLAREGFASRREFVDYWRTKRAGGSKGYKPLTQVAVYRVRPWEDTDAELCGAALIEHLYGKYLET